MTTSSSTAYTLVLDFSQQQSPVLYATDSTNITKAIIDAYNVKSGVPAPPAGHPAEPGPQTTPTAPKPAPRGPGQFTGPGFKSGKKGPEFRGLFYQIRSSFQPNSEQSFADEISSAPPVEKIVDFEQRDSQKKPSFPTCQLAFCLVNLRSPLFIYQKQQTPASLLNATDVSGQISVLARSFPQFPVNG